MRPRKTRPQDTLLAFFAGHGTTIDDQYYFLPYEFRQGDGSRAECVRQQGVPAADVGGSHGSRHGAETRAGVRHWPVGQAQPRHANRSQSVRFARRNRAAQPRGKAPSRSPPARVSEQAHEVADLKHGVLTYALLAGLRAAGEGPLEKQWIEPHQRGIAWPTCWNGSALPLPTCRS